MFVLHCSTRRPFLLAFALGALLWAGVCRADSPPPLVCPTHAVSLYKLPLLHANARDVMRIMRWDNPNPPVSPGTSGKTGAPAAAPPALPEGVQGIYVLEDDNSLLIAATPDGFARVREIVKNLDSDPRPVRLKVQFVRARIADVKAFHLSAVHSSTDYAGGLLANLLQKGNTVVLSRTTDTTNNIPVSFLFQADVLRAAGNVETVHTDLQVSPRLNSDGTITLSVLPTDLDAADRPHSPEGAPPSTQARLQTFRTVRNDETMVIDGLLRGKETELLVFITPTLLPLQSAIPSGEKP